MSSLLNDIHAEDVANYLNRNREFFHVFPNLLNELSIPHPKSGREVSLLERQVFQLREQRDSLQFEVETLKDIAGENGILLHKVYDLAYALMAAETESAAVEEIYRIMQEVFEVEAVTMISWEVPKHSVQGLYQLGVSQAWSHSLKETLQPDKPVCGLLEESWQRGLFHSAQLMQSACVIPLGQERVWGALALGATSDRFSPDLGTYFLTVMGKMITARLNRLF